MNRPKSICFVLLVLVLLLMLPGHGGAESIAIEAVTVSVQAGDAAPPTRVIKRMEQSVAVVGDHVLTGRKVADVETGKASYEKIIREVFDRVLVGYSVQEVTITPGPSTNILVRIQPWGDVVRSVVVETDLGALSPQLLELLKRDMGDVEEKVSQVLVGMPVDSVDWAGSVSKAVIREIIAAQLPEFRTNLEIVAGQVTTVRLSLAPIGPLIQDVRVTLRSRTIPNFLLLDARPVMEEEAGLLRGLPVAFVERHRDYFQTKLTNVALRQPVTRRYGLQLTPNLRVGPDTELLISAETKKYNVTLEGFLDIGRTTHDTSARLHVGQYFGKDELFMEVTLIPRDVTWQFAPGWGHRLGPKTEAGAKYNLNEEHGLLWLKQELNTNWSLRLERMPATGASEFGLRYKLHDFLSVEYVITNKDNWLRLVGNL